MSGYLFNLESSYNKSLKDVDLITSTYVKDMNVIKMFSNELQTRTTLC